MVLIWFMLELLDSNWIVILYDIEIRKSNKIDQIISFSEWYSSFILF